MASFHQIDGDPAKRVLMHVIMHSQNVAAAGFHPHADNPEVGVLVIGYKQAKPAPLTFYYYEPVSRLTYEALLAAPSAGRFVAEVIKKGGFPCRKAQ